MSFNYEKIEADLPPSILDDDEKVSRFGRSNRSQSEDHHEKRSKTAELTNKGINPLLILLLVCVVCTWGIAATLVFNLVDYRGIIDKGKNVDVCEEDIKLAIGALYPFQYEIIRHPIKAVGQFLINVDDYITEALSPKKDPYTLVDRRKTVPPSHPAQYVKKKVGWAKNLKSLPTKEEPTPTRAPETLQSSHFKAVVKENRFFRVYRRTPKYPKLPVISETVEASEVENNSIGNIIDAKDSLETEKEEDDNDETDSFDSEQVFELNLKEKISLIENDFQDHFAENNTKETDLENTTEESDTVGQADPKHTNEESDPEEQTDPVNTTEESDTIRQANSENTNEESELEEQTDPENVTEKSELEKQTDPKNTTGKSEIEEQTDPVSTTDQSDTIGQADPENTNEESDLEEQTYPENATEESVLEETDTENTTEENDSEKQTDPLNTIEEIDPERLVDLKNITGEIDNVIDDLDEVIPVDFNEETDLENFNVIEKDFQSDLVETELAEPTTGNMVVAEHDPQHDALENDSKQIDFVENNSQEIDFEKIVFQDYFGENTRKKNDPEESTLGNFVVAEHELQDNNSENGESDLKEHSDPENTTEETDQVEIVFIKDDLDDPHPVGNTEETDLEKIIVLENDMKNIVFAEHDLPDNIIENDSKEIDFVENNIQGDFSENTKTESNLEESDPEIIVVAEHNLKDNILENDSKIDFIESFPEKNVGGDPEVDRQVVDLQEDDFEKLDNVQNALKDMVSEYFIDKTEPNQVSELEKDMQKSELLVTTNERENEFVDNTEKIILKNNLGGDILTKTDFIENSLEDTSAEIVSEENNLDDDLQNSPQKNNFDSENSSKINSQVIPLKSEQNEIESLINTLSTIRTYRCVKPTDREITDHSIKKMTVSADVLNSPKLKVKGIIKDSQKNHIRKLTLEPPINKKAASENKIVEKAEVQKIKNQSIFIEPLNPSRFESNEQKGDVEQVKNQDVKKRSICIQPLNPPKFETIQLKENCETQTILKPSLCSQPTNPPKFVKLKEENFEQVKNDKIMKSSIFLQPTNQPKFEKNIIKSIKIEFPVINKPSIFLEPMNPTKYAAKVDSKAIKFETKGKATVDINFLNFNFGNKNIIELDAILHVKHPSVDLTFINRKTLEKTYENSKETNVYKNTVNIDFFNPTKYSSEKPKENGLGQIFIPKATINLNFINPKSSSIFDLKDSSSQRLKNTVDLTWQNKKFYSKVKEEIKNFYKTTVDITWLNKHVCENRSEFEVTNFNKAYLELNWLNKNKDVIVTDENLKNKVPKMTVELDFINKNFEGKEFKKSDEINIIQKPTLDLFSINFVKKNKKQKGIETEDLLKNRQTVDVLITNKNSCTNKQVKLKGNRPTVNLHLVNKLKIEIRGENARQILEPEISEEELNQLEKIELKTIKLRKNKFWKKYSDEIRQLLNIKNSDLVEKVTEKETESLQNIQAKTKKKWQKIRKFFSELKQKLIGFFKNLDRRQSGILQDDEKIVLEKLSEESNKLWQQRADRTKKFFKQTTRDTKKALKLFIKLVNNTDEKSNLLFKSFLILFILLNLILILVFYLIKRVWF